METRFPFKPSKKSGQNLLVNESVLELETELLDCSGETVLEIGAGTGNWTEKISERAEKVYAIEKDERLAELLEEKFSGTNVKVLIADALSPETSYPKATRIASNVPYSISSPLLERIASEDFELGVLCLQKEFVERMIAPPESEHRSRLSVTSQLRFNMEKAFKVSRNAFKPQPHVDSTVIVVQPKGKPLGEFFKGFLRAAFEHKNKKLRNALADSAHEINLERERVKTAVEQLTFKDKRATELSNKELQQASSQLEEILHQ